MSDPSIPLSWPHGKPGSTAEGRSATPADAFAWPCPPYPAYPQAQPQTSPEPCEILGLNNGRTLGHIILMAPHERLAQVNIPPSRGASALKYSQFRALRLTRPLPAAPKSAASANELLALDLRPRTNFTLHFNGGGDLKGTTIGHFQDDNGLFLFPPVSESDDSVRRVFVPREVLASFEIGERIGELLVQEQLATTEQVEAIAKEQQGLRTQRVGDILVAKKIVTAEQLMQAIEQQSRMPMVRIGEALLALELITQQQLETALAQQAQDRSVPLGELLVRKGVVSRQALQSALARKMGYPVVDVEHFPVEVDAIRKLPFAAAKRLEVLPLVLRDGRMVVAMEDPTRRDALDEVEFITQLKVTPTLAKVNSLQIALPSAYERASGEHSVPRDFAISGFQPDFDLIGDSDKLVETLEREVQERNFREDDTPIEQSDNSLVRLINSMIIEAHGQGVSDIHIETYPGREKLKIRFRRDGALHPYLELPHTYRNAMIARIKIMCELDISERRKPQDGKINFARYSSQHKLELRVATIPTNNGLEDVVMRLLSSARPIPLDRLGLTPANLAGLKAAVSRPYGLVLCVGPTGSGKTTTLHSAMGHINTPERKIWTAEDPIEITQTGLRQVQVNPKIEWTFAKALRSFLRADPDVIMVGEIRDQETAQIAVEASLTGHLVLSTLHTNSAPETITRLLDMGMDPFNFGDSLLAVLAQRLVRRLCTHCRTATPLSEAEQTEWLDDYLHAFPVDLRPDRDVVLGEWLKQHGVNGQLQHWHATGCSKCENTGFRGRAGMHELLTISKPLRRLIQTGARAEELAHAAAVEGMRSLRQDGILKVLSGVTTIEEVRATSNA
jgi:type II secretory ATPase GspE/PulE/Tfp pilus assembly ATPase PilB-like protein